MSISEETRKKLSIAAKRNNNFGGIILIKKKCEQCGKLYKGNSNSKRCETCKNIGYELICEHCHTKFYSKYKDTKYCSVCVDNRVWSYKLHTKEIIEKRNKSRQKWINSEEGKLAYKRIGKINSIKMKKYLKTEQGKKQIKSVAKKQSKIMKERILNGTFTPNITNSFTHWDAKVLYKNKLYKFRSSWEACFWLSNSTLKFESFECRVKYFNKKLNTYKIVIGDFFNTKNNILYEIKPKSFYLKQSEKIDALINHCINNNYKFIWINEFNIMDYINEYLFDNDINKIQLQKLKQGINYNG